MTQAVTLICTACKQRFRLTRMEPSVIIQAPSYCPICGHNQVSVTLDSEQDFWEAMARTYNMKIKLLQLLYAVWSEEYPIQHYRFSEFVSDAIANRA